MENNWEINIDSLSREYIQDIRMIENNILKTIVECSKLFPFRKENRLVDFLQGLYDHKRGYHAGIISALFHLLHSDEYVELDRKVKLWPGTDYQQYANKEWMHDDIFLQRINSNINLPKGKTLSADTVNVQFMGRGREGTILTLTPNLFLPKHSSNKDIMLEIKDYSLFGYKSSVKFHLFFDDQFPVYAEVHVEDEHNFKQLSSKAFLEQLFEKEASSDVSTVISRPAVRKYYSDIGQIDQIFCIRIKGDETVQKYLQTWARRSTIWPNDEAKLELLKSPIYIVPTGLEKNQNYWRLSFSVHENQLFKFMLPMARKVYKFCKLAMEKYTTLPSYFLKTTLFWMLEEIPSKWWKTNKLVLVIGAVFQRLLLFCCKGVIPYYFVPKHNLLDSKPKHAIKTYCKQLDFCNKNIMLLVNHILVEKDVFSTAHTNVILNANLSTWNKEHTRDLVTVIPALYKAAIKASVEVLNSQIDSYFTTKDNSEMDHKLHIAEIQHTLLHTPTIIQAFSTLCFEKDVPLENAIIWYWHETLNILMDRYYCSRDASHCLVLGMLCYLAIDQSILMWADCYETATFHFHFLLLKVMDFGHTLTHDVSQLQELNKLSPFTKQKLLSTFTEDKSYLEHRKIYDILHSATNSANSSDFMRNFTHGASCLLIPEVSFQVHTFLGEISDIKKNDPIYQNSTIQLVAQISLANQSNQWHETDNTMLANYAHRYYCLMQVLFNLRQKKNQQTSGKVHKQLPLGGVQCLLQEIQYGNQKHDFFVFRKWQKMLFGFSPELSSVFDRIHEDIPLISINVQYLLRLLKTFTI